MKNKTKKTVSKIKLTEEQVSLMKPRVVLTIPENNVYLNCPYWYKQTNERNVFEIIQTGKLPDDLVRVLGIEEPEDKHLINKGIMTHLEAIKRWREAGSVSLMTPVIAEKPLYRIKPDKKPHYKYSDGLFDWFYSKVKYYSFYHNVWFPFSMDKEATKKDHSHNGCRITLSNGEYIKFTNVYFLMEFTETEWKYIYWRCLGARKLPTMQDVIDYYYSHILKKSK